MSNLTQRQEKFVRALIAGKSQRQAYKEAYNATKMKDETIDTRACELLKNSKVKARYDQLLEEHKNKALYTREEMVNDLYPDKKNKADDTKEKDIAKVLKEAFEDI